MRNFYRFAVASLGLVLYSCGGLVYNAQIGNIERMEQSLEGGVSIETANQVGSTALIAAAFSGQTEHTRIVALLKK